MTKDTVLTIVSFGLALLVLTFIIFCPVILLWVVASSIVLDGLLAITLGIRAILGVIFNA